MTKKSANLALVYLFISLLGLILIPLIIINPSLIVITIPWQRQIIWGIFILICILGTLAGISPASCSLRFHSKLRQEQQPTQTQQPPSQSTITKRGHHPTCEHYTGHILKIHTKILCAGCTGLVLGALIAILGATLFWFGVFPVCNPTLLFWLGFVGVLVGLLQHPFYASLRRKWGVVRMAINVIFVTGAFLLLAGVTELTQNLILQAFLLILILYWIYTRIAMSKRSHNTICRICGKTDCAFYSS
jgi:hypothetical protein